MKSTFFSPGFLAALFLLFCVSLTSCIPKEKTAVHPVAVKLALESSLEQGLPVYYRYSFYRHIDNMPEDDSMITEGKAGKPVPFLNHQFKESVFDSKSEKGVGVFLTGYLKMKEAGTYQFKAMSNDGVRVMVNEEEVVLDPTVHSDRFSPVGEMTIDEPGWYPLTVKYFQRKGTARLELYWQPPGNESFEIIPASAYGHIE